MPRKRQPPKIIDINGTSYASWYDSDLKRTRRFSLEVAYADETATNEAFAFWLLNKPHVAGDHLTVQQALDYYRDEHVLANNPDGTRKVVDRARLWDERRDGTPHGVLPNLAAHFGALLAKDVDESDVTAYCEKRRGGRIGRPSQNATIRRELGALVAALNHNRKKKTTDGKRRISEDDMPEIALPTVRGPKTRWLTPDEANKLLKATMREGVPRLGEYTRAFLFCKIALCTAARRASIERLSVFQVDLEGMKIDFNEEGRQRTKKKRAHVRISDDLFPIIKAAKEHALETGSEWILGHPGSIRTTFESAVAYSAREYGLDDNGVTRHTLRHTWATWAAMYSKGTMWEVMWNMAGVMGDDIDTIMANYAKHHPDHQDGAVNFDVGGAAKRKGGG